MGDVERDITEVDIEDEGDVEEILPTEADERTFEADFDGRPASIAIVESIDADAIDTLFTESGGENDLVAEFSISSYRVKIRNGGKIDIEDVDPPSTE